MDCPNCLKGSQHQQISRYPFKKATRPLERVSCDIAGKMRCPDCTWNYQHLVVFINHYTRYVWVFLVIKRDMAIRALEILKTSAKNQSGHKILVLQTDNAAEFVGKKWTKLCQDNGIEHITTQPYAPSMHSYVERVIRTIVEHASTMLWTAGINENFWALACKASAYLLNRSPHTCLDVTPYEMWHGRKPHVGHIRIWGCRAYAAILKEKRTKFDSKSKDCILVGFYDVENLYQLWDIEGKQLIKRRDVIFHERVMGHPDIARDRIMAGRLITGQEKGADGADEKDTSLEHLYPVIDVLKPDEWRDIPATHLTSLPTTILQVHQNRDSIPRTYQEAMSSRMANHWKEACQVEHTAMITNNVYTWAELPDRTIHDALPLPLKWLFVIKRKADWSIDKYKARIVAGGHRQREGLDFHETYAPVAMFVSLRILLTMAAIDDLEIVQCDIVTAFLYGDLDEVVFMKAPAGISPKIGQKFLNAAGDLEQIIDTMMTLYWRLHKSLYRLRQSPRCFYKRLDSVLAGHGYRRIPADYGVWLAQHEVVLIVHVDDMQMIGTKAGIGRLKGVLESKFMIKSLGGGQLFLGLHIERQRHLRQITISQKAYAKQILERFGMLDAHPCTTPMDLHEDWEHKEGDILLDAEEKRTYQSAIGSLIYLMLGTRPDLAFSINKLAKYSANPTQRHWKGIKRILRFVKATIDAKLVLGKTQETTETKCPSASNSHTIPQNKLVVGYFDAAYMDNTQDRHSTIGYMFFISGSPVSWMSNKQRVVALSTTEAEYLAGTEATKEAVWIQTFLQAIGIPRESILPIQLYGDNQSTNALAKNPEYHVRTKHIHGKQKYITEMVEQGVIGVTYIPTTCMIADTLTKALPRTKYEDHMRLMRVWCIKENKDKTCWTCAFMCESKNGLHRHLKERRHHRTWKAGTRDSLDEGVKGMILENHEAGEALEGLTAGNHEAGEELEATKEMEISAED